MEAYSKYITGHVVQNFVKKNGEFVCTDQHFTASDDTTYEEFILKICDHKKIN